SASRREIPATSADQPHWDEFFRTGQSSPWLSFSPKHIDHCAAGLQSSRRFIDPLELDRRPSMLMIHRIDDLPLAHSFAALPAAFYTRLMPTPLPHPYLVCTSGQAAELIGLDTAAF